MSRRVTKSLLKSVSSLVLATGMCAAFTAINASATDYTVALNKTKILHLPGAASAVVVGNPDIADISVHSSDTLFLVGRGYGETNLIALDEFGHTIMEANIIVRDGMPASGIRIIKVGAGQESYNCTPACLPTPILGDSNSFRSRFGGNGSPINNTQASSGAGPAGNSGGQPSTALSAFPAQQGGPGSSGPTGPSGFAGPPSGPPMNER